MDSQEKQYKFGQDLQHLHGFKLISPSHINRDLITHKLLTHVIVYQKNRNFDDQKFNFVIDCIVTIPFDDVTRIGVDFKLQFESFTGTVDLNNFFITKDGNFTSIDVPAIITQLFEIAYTYQKTPEK